MLNRLSALMQQEREDIEMQRRLFEDMEFNMLEVSLSLVQVLCIFIYSALQSEAKSETVVPSSVTFFT